MNSNANMRNLLSTSKSPTVILHALDSINDASSDVMLIMGVVSLKKRILDHEFCNTHHVVIVGRVMDACRRVLRFVPVEPDPVPVVCVKGACCFENPRVRRSSKINLF